MDREYVENTLNNCSVGRTFAGKHRVFINDMTLYYDYYGIYTEGISMMSAMSNSKESDKGIKLFYRFKVDEPSGELIARISFNDIKQIYCEKLTVEMR